MEPRGFYGLPCELRVRLKGFSDEWCESSVVLTVVLVILRIPSGPYTDFIATRRELVVDGLLGLRCAQVDDLCMSERLEDRVELFDEFTQLLSLCDGGRVLHDLHVIRDNRVSTRAGELAGDTHRLHGRGLIGFRRADIEREVRVALVALGLQVSQFGNGLDQTLGENRERVRAILRCRDDEYLVLCVFPQKPADIRCGDPGFTDASEGFDDATARAVLQISSDVVLNRSRGG